MNRTYVDFSRSVREGGRGFGRVGLGWVGYMKSWGKQEEEGWKVSGGGSFFFFPNALPTPKKHQETRERKIKTKQAPRVINKGGY